MSSKQFLTHHPSNRIKIVSWNSQGLNSKQIELKKYIERNRPDVICIQEAHQLYIDRPFQIPGYQSYISSKTKNRAGGTATIVQEGLIVHEINTDLPDTNMRRRRRDRFTSFVRQPRQLAGFPVTVIWLLCPVLAD